MVQKERDVFPQGEILILLWVKMHIPAFENKEQKCRGNYAAGYRKLNRNTQRAREGKECRKDKKQRSPAKGQPPAKQEQYGEDISTKERK